MLLYILIISILFILQSALIFWVLWGHFRALLTTFDCCLNRLSNFFNSFVNSLISFANFIIDLILDNLFIFSSNIFGWIFIYLNLRLMLYFLMLAISMFFISCFSITFSDRFWRKGLLISPWTRFSVLTYGYILIIFCIFMIFYAISFLNGWLLFSVDLNPIYWLSHCILFILILIIWTISLFLSFRSFDKSNLCII